MGETFLPRKDRDFLAWVINFLKQLNTMLSRIAFPGSEYSLLSSQRDDFSAKLTLSEEPATRTKESFQDLRSIGNDE